MDGVGFGNGHRDPTRACNGACTSSPSSRFDGRQGWLFSGGSEFIIKIRRKRRRKGRFSEILSRFRRLIVSSLHSARLARAARTRAVCGAHVARPETGRGYVRRASSRYHVPVMPRRCSECDVTTMVHLPPDPRLERGPCCRGGPCGACCHFSDRRTVKVDKKDETFDAEAVVRRASSRLHTRLQAYTKKSRLSWLYNTGKETSRAGAARVAREAEPLIGVDDYKYCTMTYSGYT